MRRGYGLHEAANVSFLSLLEREIESAASALLCDWRKLHDKDGYFSGRKHHAALDFVARITGKMLNDVRLSANDRVIEIGCGLGVMAAIVAPRVSWLRAIDVSPLPIRVAASLLADLPSDRYKAIRGDGYQIPAQDGTVTFVYSISCFQHLPRIIVRSYVNEIRRVASADCRVFIQLSAAGGGDEDASPGRGREESVHWTEEQLKELFPECAIEAWGNCWIVQGYVR